MFVNATSGGGLAKAFLKPGKKMGHFEGYEILVFDLLNRQDKNKGLKLVNFA
jgi:hypothetical protein